MNLADYLNNTSMAEKQIKTRPDSILKEDLINYFSIPSLENIVVVNIVIKLWKEPDSQESFLNFCLKHATDFFDVDQGFDDIASKVSKKVHLLPLPNLLKDEVLNYIRPIGFELVNWIILEQQYECSKNIIEHLDSIWWTLNGTIDKEKSLKLFLRHENLEHAYKIACKNCLVDDICDLWKQMSKERQKDMCSLSLLGNACPLLTYWTYLNKNKLSEISIMFERFHNNIYIYDLEHSIEKNMFTLVMLDGNVAAAKYFWYRLTSEEIDKYIVSWTCHLLERKSDNWIRFQYQNSNGYADVLFFLISQMKDNEQQREVLKEYSAVILNYLFFSWPWQKLMLSILNIMWDYLSNEVYMDFLLTVIEEIRDGRTTEKILRKLWCNSPKRLKTFFIEYLVTDTGLDALWNLFKIEDFKTIKLMLNDVDEEDRKELLCSTTSKKLFPVIINWNLTSLEYLIFETGMSENEINNSKKNTVLNFSTNLYREGINAGNWQAYDKFIFWAFSSQDQRDTYKATMMDQIIEDGQLRDFKDWITFKKFVHWCFDSNEKIDNFKEHVSSYRTMELIILHLIEYASLLEFAEQLLDWCFSSKEKIVQFKNKLMLSDNGIDTFKEILNCHNLINNSFSENMVVQLLEWYYPFEMDVLTEFKKKFTQSWIYDNGDWNSLGFLKRSLNYTFDENNQF